MAERYVRSFVTLQVSAPFSPLMRSATVDCVQRHRSVLSPVSSCTEPKNLCSRNNLYLSHPSAKYLFGRVACIMHNYHPFLQDEMRSHPYIINCLNYSLLLRGTFTYLVWAKAR